MNLNFNWTDDAATDLRTHHAAGLSASQIAVELRDKFGGTLSRNAVCGKLDRLGLTKAHRPINPPRTSRLAEPKPRAVRRRMFRFEAPTLAPAPQPAPPPAAGPPGTHQCELLDLRNESCRWPASGDGPPFLFCGDPSADMAGGRSYCAHHSRIAFDRRADRRATVQPGARHWGAAG